MSAERERLREVKTLYDILPKGVEGGKEFARIVNLLLFHEARRSGKNITLFNDAAGDYYGLDSFDISRRFEKTGYQYKFYPSPLSADHRQKIEQSLQRLAENQDALKIEKWILVTPQDLIESATRKDGGDVTWFEGLRHKFRLKCEIEHWGHRKLQSFFLETPSLCLYYYPELIIDGAARKKTIKDTRNRYNENLNTLYGSIEFVGMSVYKEEATRGVPIQDIYIPLTVIPERADESNPEIMRTNPLSFLERGARRVVLGDPGSGKSTLLKFLALIGHSGPVQKKYGGAPDERLPLLIELRGYADELKARENLSLIDYIQEVIQGASSLKSADLDFFEYYLENGQAILLFDGLDELPNPRYKQVVRDRIRTFVTTYPGNTVVVTSRIVGYGAPFRFDEKEFSHYRLTTLQLPEIEQFVRDWYRARVEHKVKQEENVKDLMRILQDKEHEAIKELAGNPLLLTIIVLVHRIDAVLPDERVVLYQKCTETLLITWHYWKYKSEETKTRGQIERQNRRRMEEIAYWMHCQSLGTEKGQRAVVEYRYLKQFLIDYIAGSEGIRSQDIDPEDQAEEFLDFVKKRAGLLIEAGENKYSFVHQTFQEYLASSCILTRGEEQGVLSIWEIIKGTCDDDRWHEVIRLLIAGLKSYNSQEALVKKILKEVEKSKGCMHALLLGGLLLDGVQAAKNYQEKIVYCLLRSASRASDSSELRLIHERLRMWIGKDELHEEVLSEVFRPLWREKSFWKDFRGKNEKMALLLTVSAMNLSKTKIDELTDNFAYITEDNAELYKFFLCESSNMVLSPSLEKRLEVFWVLMDCFSFLTHFTNLVAAASQAVNAPLEPNSSARRAFEAQLVVLVPGISYSPFLEFSINSLRIFLERSSSIYVWARNLDLIRVRDRYLVLGQALSQVLIRVQVLVRDRALTWVRDRVRDRDLDQSLEQKLDSKIDLWQSILTTPELYSFILDLLCDMFALEPQSHWWEALRVQFLPHVPERVNFYNESLWQKVENTFEKEEPGEFEIYTAASLLIFDACLYVFEYYKTKDESIFAHLADLTREIDAPPLRIAHCIRDLAYGDESRTEDLKAMVNSHDPQYRKIFETVYWRPKSK